MSTRLAPPTSSSCLAYSGHLSVFKWRCTMSRTLRGPHELERNPRSARSAPLCNMKNLKVRPVEGGHKIKSELKALSVHNGGPLLVILTLRDPHLLEGRQGRQNGSANPNAVLPLGWCDYLNPHGGRGQSTELFGHPFTDSRHHRRATGKHHVGIELLANVDITLHDGLEGGIMNAHRFLSHQTRLEQNLGATEALRVEGDDVAIRQFVGLGTFVACCCSLHLSVKVQGNVAKFLLAQLLTGTKICKRKRDVGVSENPDK